MIRFTEMLVTFRRNINIFKKRDEKSDTKTNILQDTSFNSSATVFKTGATLKIVFNAKDDQAMCLRFLAPCGFLHLQATVNME